LPVWSRHLATCRGQSETAVSDMMQAFSNISPHVHLAQQQSQQIADVLGQGNSAIRGLPAACEAALQPLLQHAQLPSGGAEAIAAALAVVRGAVGTVEHISQPLSHETHMVAEHVERMYMAFQYQDRISQMIALLEEDMARLQEVVQGRGQDIPQLGDWLGRLEAQYAMADQRHSHAGPQDGATGGAADIETTFF
jgi:hypothetical protein